MAPVAPWRLAPKPVWIDGWLVQGKHQEVEDDVFWDWNPKTHDKSCCGVRFQKSKEKNTDSGPRLNQAQ